MCVCFFLGGGVFSPLFSGASACCQFQGVPGYFLPKPNKGLGPLSTAVRWKTRQTQAGFDENIFGGKTGKEEKRHPGKQVAVNFHQLYS